MSDRPLCVDFGKKRIGVAATDYLGLAARPVEVVTATPRDAAADRIAEIARERESTVLVVGLPINMDGTTHDSETDVRAFARRLEERTGLEVHYVDERLSTVEAERLMSEVGLRRKRLKVDFVRYGVKEACCEGSIPVGVVAVRVDDASGIDYRHLAARSVVVSELADLLGRSRRQPAR